MTNHDIIDHLGTTAKYLLDALSISVVIGAVVQILPPIAAGMSILWLGMQMFAYFRRKAWQTDKEKEG